MFSSHFSSSKIPTSLWHRPAALTSMTTLPDSMVGSGMSTLSNGLWVPLNCQAFISNSYIEFDDCSSADIAGPSYSFAASLSKGQGLSVERPNPGGQDRHTRRRTVGSARVVHLVLMEHLAAAARENGIRTFTAEVLPENTEQRLNERRNSIASAHD